jgi:lipopolysaccharide/colanic/teichoic acid biosynthesis glycosyltransferase
MSVVTKAHTTEEVSAPETTLKTLTLTDVATFQFAPASGRRAQYAVKRVLDILLASVGLVLLSPILLGIIVELLWMNCPS